MLKVCSGWKFSICLFSKRKPGSKSLIVILKINKKMSPWFFFFPQQCFALSCLALFSLCYFALWKRVQHHYLSLGKILLELACGCDLHFPNLRIPAISCSELFFQSFLLWQIWNPNHFIPVKVCRKFLKIQHFSWNRILNFWQSQ